MIVLVEVIAVNLCHLMKKKNKENKDYIRIIGSYMASDEPVLC
jgi:hypothetical protein